MNDQERRPRGRVWHFAGIEFDERSLELRRDGVVVPLERKSKAVLLHLLHHAGEVVTKDELLDAVWSGRVLSDATITKTLSRLRAALDDEGQGLIKTEHGFGYRLIAEVRVEISTEAPTPALDLAPGDRPPLRPNWTLIERLGTGGHGEAWRVRHDKTGEERVFKFALDANALGSLRREITLSRLLRESLGPREDFLAIVDWNLEQPPFYFECRYLAGGNLLQWLQARGGPASLTPEQRLDIVARIADSLAAAHSVGVLHKDLKPGNVLVEGEAAGSGDLPALLLADFGSGGVVDLARLEDLGITRLGFTRTLVDTSSSTATPLYVAPELLIGQPATVKADIYALGVILYQLVVGDLQRPLAPGWEADIEDELLREDIAAAVDGHPDRRLGDAGALARRLRELPARRAERIAGRKAQLREQRARRLREELRRMRFAVVALVLLALLAIGAGLAAWQSRDQALDARAEAVAARDDAVALRLKVEHSARTTEAVSRFMTEELLGGLQLRDEPGAIDFAAILDQASHRVDERLTGFPEAAAEVHYVMGRRFIRSFERQRFHLQRASELYEQTQGPLGDDTLLVRMHLADAIEQSGQPREAVAAWRTVLDGLEQRFGSNSLLTLEARAQLAFSQLWTGAFNTTISALEAVRVAMPSAPPLSPAEIALRTRTGRTQAAELVRDSQLAVVDLMLANSLRLALSELDRAEDFGARALERFAGLEGAEIWRVMIAHQTQAELFGLLGKAQPAYALLDRADALIAREFGEQGEFRDAALEWRALVDLWQRRYASALPLLQRRLDRCRGFENCSARFTPNTREFLARSYLEVGQLDKARREFQRTLDARVQLLEADNPWTLPARTGLAEVLQRRGEPDAARAMLEVVDEQMLAAFPADSLHRARYWRASGLLAQLDGDTAAARDRLQRAWQLYQGGLGPAHWLTRRAGEELAALASSP